MKTKLVIFGITGDLAKRKLLPALEQIVERKVFDDLEIVGVSRRNVSASDVVGHKLQSVTSVYCMDLANKDDYVGLADYLGSSENQQLVFYLSVPPLATAQITEFLGLAKINGTNTKILFEKPFGVDYKSAKDMVEHAAKYYKESQIYRIDHYLAKEMAQNIVAFRSGNAMFQYVWESGAIERIDVIAVEKVGIEGRAKFYEQVGALRDLVQGHLMQLLSLTILTIPKRLNWDDLPKLRLEALKSISSADPSLAVRGQYDSYQEEVKNFGSQTETFVSLVLKSRNVRWKNVPLRLTTGKAFDKKSTEVKVYFRSNSGEACNCLRFKIQPDEGLEIDLNTKKPGYELEFETQKMLFSYPENTVLPDAYEQVIVDALNSRKSLFASSDEILESWRILQPLLDTWSMSKSEIMKYKKGSDYHAVVPK